MIVGFASVWYRLGVLGLVLLDWFHVRILTYGIFALLAVGHTLFIGLDGLYLGILLPAAAGCLSTGF